MRVLVCLALWLAAGAAPAQTACQDQFTYALGVQLADRGPWLFFKDSSAVPFSHIGGDKTLMLDVKRLDAETLEVVAGAMTAEHAFTWKASIQMSLADPKAYARVFRPSPQSPVFSIQLVPKCRGV
jgi:hypothetical protein